MAAVRRKSDTDATPLDAFVPSPPPLIPPLGPSAGTSPSSSSSSTPQQGEEERGGETPKAPRSAELKSKANGLIEGEGEGRGGGGSSEKVVPRDNPDSPFGNVSLKNRRTNSAELPSNSRVGEGGGAERMSAGGRTPTRPPASKININGGGGGGREKEKEGERGKSIRFSSSNGSEGVVSPSGLVVGHGVRFVRGAEGRGIVL